MDAYSYSDLSKMIDHSLLNPTFNRDALHQGLQVALAFDVASVCIMPFALKWCAEQLEGTSIKPSTTIGFPHGGHTTEGKMCEAKRALKDGGQELDMVVNISQVVSGAWSYVRKDILSVLEVTHDAGQKLKVIFENCYLNNAQKIALCEICGELNVDWVKTSTGYGPSGATMEDLKLMRAFSPPHVQVKAAGGVRELTKLAEVRTMGITRVGTTATATILGEARKRFGLSELEVEEPVLGAY